MKQLFAMVVLGWLSTASGFAQAPPETPIRVSDVRTIHIAGYTTELMGADKQIATCFMEKLKAQGPFRFTDDLAEADAVFTFKSTLPAGSTRVLWGQSPGISAWLKTPDGRSLWGGQNRYDKATTVWGTATNIPCGLANGLVNQLVKAIQKQREQTAKR